MTQNSPQFFRSLLILEKASSNVNSTSYLLFNTSSFSGSLPEFIFLYGGFEKIKSYSPEIFFIFSFNGIILSSRKFFFIFSSSMSNTFFWSSTAYIFPIFSALHSKIEIIPWPAPISRTVSFEIFLLQFLIFLYLY